MKNLSINPTKEKQALKKYYSPSQVEALTGKSKQYIEKIMDGAFEDVFDGARPSKGKRQIRIAEESVKKWMAKKPTSKS